jgi:hypothetical protein
VACATAEFREETSKKQTTRQRRVAAMHNLGPATLACKSYFAVQHRNERAPFSVTRLRYPKPSNYNLLSAQAHMEPHRAGVSGPL